MTKWTTDPYTVLQKKSKKYEGKMRHKPEMSQPHFLNIYFTDTLYYNG